MWLASAWLQGGDGPESRCSENDDMLLGREKLNIDGHSKDFFLAISCARLQESKLSALGACAFLLPKCAPLHNRRRMPYLSPSPSAALRREKHGAQFGSQQPLLLIPSGPDLNALVVLAELFVKG
jgi:hypothetical protein